MKMPPLLADFTHTRVCKPFCEKSLTLPPPVLPKRLVPAVWRYFPVPPRLGACNTKKPREISRGLLSADDLCAVIVMFQNLLVVPTLVGDVPGRAVLAHTDAMAISV